MSLPGEGGSLGGTNLPTPRPRPRPTVQRDRRVVTTPSYNTGGGGGGRRLTGGGGSGGGGGGATAPVKVPKPKPPPTLAQWLATDSDYQDQLRQFSKSLSDFNADSARNRGKVTSDYKAGTTQMGDQRVKDLQDIMNDFASRGLLKSGLFGQREADYEKQYQQNLSDLTRSEQNQLGDLSTQTTQFKRQQELQQETARKDAAARRAAKFGL